MCNLCQNFNSIPSRDVEKTEKQFNSAILLITNSAPRHGMAYFEHTRMPVQEHQNGGSVKRKR